MNNYDCLSNCQIFMSSSSGDPSLPDNFSKLLIQQRNSILGTKYEDKIIQATTAAKRFNNSLTVFGNGGTTKYEDLMMKNDSLIHRACLINYNSIKINLDEDLQKKSSLITSVATKTATTNASSSSSYDFSSNSRLLRDSSSQSTNQQNSSLDIESSSDTASDESVFGDDENKLNDLLISSLKLNDESSSSSSSSCSNENDDDYIQYIDIDGYLFEIISLRIIIIIQLLYFCMVTYF